MMYDYTTQGNKDFGRSSAIPGKSRKAPPNPPSPPSDAFSSSQRFCKYMDPEIPWGERKPKAMRKPESTVASMSKSKNKNKNKNNKTKNGTSSNDDSNPNFVEIEIGDTLSNSGKDGILFPRNSPQKQKPAGEKEIDPRFDSKDLEKKKVDGSDGVPGPEKDEESGTDQNGIGRGRMSKREMFWATLVFAVIATLTLMTTFIVVTRNTRSATVKNGVSMSKDNMNHGGDGRTAAPTASENYFYISPWNDGNGGAIGSGQSDKLSIREEWELVYSAIRDNEVTRVLLKGRDAPEEALPYDLYFYEDLVSGMIFSEDERDWISAPPQFDDIINMDMSMTGTLGGYENGTDGSGNKKRPSTAKKLTPNQKATAWLLFHDDLKDPSESVWRWTMASIYFRMGGKNWMFHNRATNENKWFTNAPLCEWELFHGSSGCDKNKQATGSPLLPVELEFGDTNMSGTIAIEFSLLVLPADNPVTATNNAVDTDTFVRSITLTDNRLTGTVPGAVFKRLMPSLGKLYLDNNKLTGSIPPDLGGLDALYMQNNEFTGDWPQEFCGPGADTVDDFGLDCDEVVCTCCDIHQCYFSRS